MISRKTLLIVSQVLYKELSNLNENSYGYNHIYSANQEIQSILDKPFMLDIEELRNIYEKQGKLQCVKYYKDHTGHSLMISKQDIESLAIKYNWKRYNEES